MKEKREESASDLVQQVNILHEQMMQIYISEISALKIRIAHLEEENKVLNERLRSYEG